jgi:O-antigen/teichoic acid export membrane protein
MWGGTSSLYITVEVHSAFAGSADSGAFGMKRFGLRQRAIDSITGLASGGIHINIVLRSAASVMTVRVAGAGIAYVLQLLVAQWLGAYEYGIFAYSWVWLSILSYLAPFGLNGAVVKFIPDYLSKQRWRRVKGVIYRSRSIVLVAASGLAGIGALSVFLGRGLIPNYYINPLYVALACVPFFALMNLYEGMGRSFGWVNLAYAPTYIIRPALFIIAMGVLFYSGVPLNGTNALVLVFISVLIAVSGQALLFGRRLPTTIRKAQPVYHSLYWIRTSLPFMLILAFQIILTDTDMIMLGGFVEPDAVAIYFASIRTASLIAFITFAISALAVPKFAALHANGTQEDLQALVTGVVQWIFWPSLIFAIILLIFGRPILSLFGPAFTAGYPVLALLMLGHLVKAATGPIDHLLNMTGNQSATVLVIGCSGAMNIVLNAILIPYLGLIGAAIATTSSIIISTVWLLILVKQRLGLNALVFSRKKQIPAAVGSSDQS